MAAMVAMHEKMDPDEAPQEQNRRNGRAFHGSPPVSSSPR